MKAEPNNRTSPSGPRAPENVDLFIRGEAALKRAKAVSRKIAKRVRQVVPERASEVNPPDQPDDTPRKSD